MRCRRHRRPPGPTSPIPTASSDRSSPRAGRHTGDRPEAGPGPFCIGRGLELELDEAAFGEGSAFLLGSVLELVFRRLVTLNGFVSTIVRSRERGELVRWPARIGSRHLL